MRICHITPHLPPDQAANALLPAHLGAWQREQAHEVVYVAHPARAPGSVALPGPVVWLPRPRPTGRPLARRLQSLRGFARLVRRAGPVIARADLVHVHSNGLLPEAGLLLAALRKTPSLLTLYGTEVWHYSGDGAWPDLFRRAYRSAGAVTFYSRKLRDRAIELGLWREGLEVIYPPVVSGFRRRTAQQRTEARHRLGIGEEPLLLNVKRLHPLAGQHLLLEAMPRILHAQPAARLTICGTGPLEADLKAQVSRLSLSQHVTFAGLVSNEAIADYYAAADLFVLPSELEACPTVAVEALACGTPVVSTDNPGGVELSELFPDDVAVVPRNDIGALAAAIAARLERGGRASSPADRVLERLFRPAAVAEAYRTLYARVLAGR